MKVHMTILQGPIRDGGRPLSSVVCGRAWPYTVSYREAKTSVGEIQRERLSLWT